MTPPSRSQRRPSGRAKPIDGSATPNSVAPPPSSLWRLQQSGVLPGQTRDGWLPFRRRAPSGPVRAEVDSRWSTRRPHRLRPTWIGGVVNRLTGVPWVAEFRYPWWGTPSPPAPVAASALAGPGSTMDRLLGRRLVFATPSTTRHVSPPLPARRGDGTITNGHDRSEMSNPGRRRSLAGFGSSGRDPLSPRGARVVPRGSGGPGRAAPRSWRTGSRSVSMGTFERVPSGRGPVRRRGARPAWGSSWVCARTRRARGPGRSRRGPRDAGPWSRDGAVRSRQALRLPRTQQTGACRPASRTTLGTASMSSTGGSSRTRT